MYIVQRSVIQEKKTKHILFSSTFKIALFLCVWVSVYFVANVMYICNIMMMHFHTPKKKETQVIAVRGFTFLISSLSIFSYFLSLPLSHSHTHKICALNRLSAISRSFFRINFHSLNWIFFADSLSNMQSDCYVNRKKANKRERESTACVQKIYIHLSQTNRRKATYTRMYYVNAMLITF